MSITEAERHDLFTRLEELLGPERTLTMSKMMLTDLSQLATKDDLAAMAAGMATKDDLAALEIRLMRSFVTWMLMGQASLVAVVALVVSIA